MRLTMVEGIELEEARRLILERSAAPRMERVSLLEAHGRVAAEDIAAPLDQPPFDRSPLDGYALMARDTAGASPAAPAILEVIDTVYAGGYSRKEVISGTAVRLMTGSPIPAGADCVIRQEDVGVSPGRVEIPRPLSRGDNYCFQGENIRKGEIVIVRDAPLRAAEIGVLAGLGLAAVPVYRKPVAAVISTGDELVEPGAELAPGQIYSSNFHALACRLRECGVEVIPAGISGDDSSVIAEAIARIIDAADLVITTGGVSVGERDLLKESLASLGAEMIFWKVNIKPGSPALFSVLQGKPVISLSGNPLAASVTFDLLLRPFIGRLTGNRSLELKTLEAVLQNDFNKKSPIRRALRGQFMRDPGGRALVRIIDAEQSPGNLKVILNSNCYIDVQKGSPGLKQGETVPVYL